MAESQEAVSPYMIGLPDVPDDVLEFGGCFSLGRQQRRRWRDAIDEVAAAVRAARQEFVTATGATVVPEPPPFSL